jgi:mRNA interferase MazF
VSYPLPSRGDVWLVDLNPTRGHEQAGVRPALVVSTNLFNQGPAGLVVVLPLTTTQRDIPLHVAIDPPEGGLRQRSFAKCEDIRSIASERLRERWGTVVPATLRLVEDRLRVLLEIP